MADFAANQARWADTFLPATTNIASRIRMNRDKERHVQDLVNEEEQEFRERLTTDRTAQNLYFQQRNLELRERESAQRIRHADALLPLKERAEETRINAALARERASVVATELKERLAKQEADDTEGLSTSVNGLLDTMKAGTRDYAVALAKLRSQYPAANRTLFTDLWKTTGIDKSPEDVLKEATDLQKQVAQIPGASATVSQSGTSVRVGAPKETTNPDLKRLQHVEGLRSRQKRNDKGEYENKDVVDYLDAEITRLRESAGIQQEQPTAQADVFSDEASARAAGKKTGDIVTMINPKTGKPARARLD